MTAEQAMAEALKRTRINGQRLRLTDAYAVAMVAEALAALSAAGFAVVPREEMEAAIVVFRLDGDWDRAAKWEAMLRAAGGD